MSLIKSQYSNSDCLTVIIQVFPLPSTLSFSECSRCECTNKILMLLRYDDFRVIFSPDYPRIYCPNLTCAWRVVAPENYSQIHFFAKKIDLRDGKDFIHFFESKTGTELDADLSNATHS